MSNAKLHEIWLPKKGKIIFFVINITAADFKLAFNIMTYDDSDYI